MSPFSGLMDEFAVIDRALSESEITEMYDKEIPSDKEGLQLLLHFDNDPAYGENESFVYDHSGNGNLAVYDGHPNILNRWTKKQRAALMGYSLFYQGSWSGFGQPAVNEGILYVPNGKLTAYNVTNGDIIWENGAYPLSDDVSNPKFS